MNFNPTEDQAIIIQGISKFIKNDLADDISQNDSEGKFSFTNWKKCAEFGILGLPLPEEYGGNDCDLLTTAMAIENLAFNCRDNGLVHAITTQILCELMIFWFGTDYQKDRFLPLLASGDQIACQAITEADAGSDVSALRTKAEKNGNKYILNGAKMFITNAPISDIAIVFAKTDTTKKIGGISCFIIDSSNQGLKKGNPLEKLGLRTLQNGELIIEDCEIGDENLLGKEGQGMFIFNEGMESERILLPAAHIGSIERILEQTISYSKTRKQFGQRIFDFQAITNKIAEMKVNLELGKLIIYKSAWLKDQGKRVPIETSIAKLFISEALQKASADALQIHGGYGFMKEYDIEKEYRDSAAATIYSGTSEMQKNIIAAMLK